MRDSAGAVPRPGGAARAAVGETIKAAVFDLDGTLANTLPAISRLLVKVASEQGRPVTARQAAAAIGKPPGPAFGKLLGMPEDHDAVVAAIGRYRELFAYEVLREGPRLLFPGVAAGLSALRAHGIELAVATSKGTRGAEALLDVLGIRDLLGPVITQDMVRRGKPHPEMVLRAAADLGVAPWESAYVGDTVGDMRMAVTARMEPVAVTYGVGSFGELAAVAGTRMCGSFKDVVSTIAAARPRPMAAAAAHPRKR
ncbi:MULTISPECIES: HAD family hydrolase [Streptomyces]|uniref:HAD family hydrolase n=2 Tax=Streptomyces rimosus subsp. rimosus TaxID=132474 RepID=A0A8A1UT45_STRR1|nr:MULTISPECIES: HAD family hydrolase [Streptomyces]MYT45540.1 HAD-IA family hydrolase [Streptomyces sp. SID5471]KOT40458.1 hydrolase [Streptomyces sp. NRRL WC-3701]KOT41436.1 hydrolase [Streptomyces rimosus subsp. rimosus]KOT58230.1 hydrolase [Streptomyces rimosus subsp. rimosus]KOT60060.1 hydrolase [Streptomyces rimosus subsp. rimosus]